MEAATSAICQAPAPGFLYLVGSSIATRCGHVLVLHVPRCQQVVRYARRATPRFFLMTRSEAIDAASDAAERNWKNKHFMSGVRVEENN